MKLNIKKIVYISFVGLLFMSCKKEVNSNTNSGDAISDSEKELIEVKSQHSFVIRNTGFYSVSSGEKLDLKKSLISGTLKTPEGIINVFYSVVKQNDTLGYVIQKPVKTKLIGTIFVTSPKVKTKEGLGVGSTYGAVKKAFPLIELYGSKTVSRTHFNADLISFKFNQGLNEYQLEDSVIDESAKMIEMMINTTGKL